MHFLSCIFLLPLCATLSAIEPAVKSGVTAGMKSSEAEVKANLMFVSEKQEFPQYHVIVASEELQLEREAVGGDLDPQPEVDVDTPTDVEMTSPVAGSRLVKRNAVSNLDGIPWLDACGQAMPITPTALADSRTYHHAVVYNDISNEYLVAFDVDLNFNGRPDRVYVTRRNVFCYNNASLTIGPILGISIRASSQGWPVVTHNPHKNEYLVLYQARLSSAWVIVGQRISAEIQRTARHGSAFLALSVKDRNGRRLHTFHPSVVYVPDTEVYMVAGQVIVSSAEHGVYYQVRVACFTTALKQEGAIRVVPFGLSVYRPHLVHDPIFGWVYAIVRADWSVVNQTEVVISDSVSVRHGDRYVLVYQIVLGKCDKISNQVIVIGSTNVSNPNIQATWNAHDKVIVVVWDDTDDSGSDVLNSMTFSGQTVRKGSGKFNSLDENPIKNAAVTYFPPYRTPVVLWEEKIRSNWYLGGSLLLPGSIAMFSPAQHQTSPSIIHVSRGGSDKLIVVWRHHVRWNIRLFAQCLCDSQRDLPPQAHNLIIGRRGLFFWIPPKQKSSLSALFNNEIPDSTLSDFSLVDNRMAWYNGLHNTIQTSDMDGQNQNTAATGVNRPGAIVGDFGNNIIYFTDPTDKSVIAISTYSGFRKTVAVDVEDPNSIAVNRNSLIMPDGSGGITSTVVGGDSDDGDKVLLHRSLQSDDDAPTSSDILITGGDTTLAGNTNQDKLAFHANSTIQTLDLNTGFATTIATGVSSVSSLAGSNNTVCWHNDKEVDISCASNNSDSKDTVRKNVFNSTKLHFQQDGSSTASNPCTVENGGCEQFCVPTDDGHECDCGDDYIVNGSNCILPEPCPTCSGPSLEDEDICWVTKSDTTFVFSGEAGNKIQKKKRVRYTILKVEILHGRPILSKKKLFKMKKSIRVWLNMPVCCPTLERGEKYIFVGKENQKKELVIPKHRGQVLEWSKKMNRNTMKQLTLCK